MSTREGDPANAGQGQPTEEELRAAYEAEIKKVRVEQVLLEHVVTMVNLGMRRTGLAPGTESERDPEQVRVAIESIRALLALLERSAPEQIGPIRDALSQLQLAYVQIGGSPVPSGSPAPGGPQGDPGAHGGPRTQGGAGPQEGAGRQGESGGGGRQERPSGREPEPSEGPPPPKPGEPGPAQRSGRLWVPGQ